MALCSAYAAGDVDTCFQLWHKCRAIIVIIIIENGDDMKTVQTNLGHATASFTLDVYGHVSQRMHQQSAERMERFIQSVTG